MPSLPILSGQEVIDVLEKFGYRKSRQRSSHIRLVCDGRRSVTVPDYKTIGRGLLRKILRDVDLSVEKFVRELN